jgi:hypothetical protein
MFANDVLHKGAGKGHLRKISIWPAKAAYCRRCHEIIVDERAWQFAGNLWEHVVCPPRYRDKSDDLD